MFIGSAISRRRRWRPGGVYNYKDGRTAPDTINVLLEYPAEFTATFEATLAPGNQRRGGGIRRHRGAPATSTGRHYEFHAGGKECDSRW